MILYTSNLFYSPLRHNQSQNKQTYSHYILLFLALLADHKNFNNKVIKYFQQITDVTVIGHVSGVTRVFDKQNTHKHSHTHTHSHMYTDAPSLHKWQRSWPQTYSTWVQTLIELCQKGVSPFVSLYQLWRSLGPFNLIGAHKQP